MDVEQIWGAGWIPADRVADAVQEAKTELDVLWPNGGNAPDKRDVVYLFDSLRLGLYRRAQQTRVAAPPPAPAGTQTNPVKQGQAIQQKLSASGPNNQGPQWDQSGDSRAQYQGYRSGLRERE